MKKIERVTVTEDVTLVSLYDSPADIRVVSDIFSRISAAGVDVDMISQTPAHGKQPNLSFTVSGEDLGILLKLSAELRKENPRLKLSVSSGNCKISVFGEGMRGCPGVAARVFEAAAGTDADTILITTSEVDISLLVPRSCMQPTVEAIAEAFSD